MSGMGALKITCLNGENLHNCDHIFGQDPYVVFSLGNAAAFTSTLHFGGTNPVWAQTVQVIVHPKHSQNGSTLNIECRDYDVFQKDDVIGRGTLDVSHLLWSHTSTSTDGTVQLKRRKKRGGVEVDAGRINLQVTFIPLKTQGEYDAYEKAVMKAAVKKTAELFMLTCVD